MPHRLQVIEEIKIEFEVPYITGKGEVVDAATVQINERKQGVCFSYALSKRTGKNLDVLFPPEGIDLLGQMTSQIIRDLGMSPRRIILQLYEYSPNAISLSAEGRAPVNRERDTVLIILTKTPFVYKFGYEMVLWHQAMHAKDRWEHRFPSAHPLVHVGDWLDVLWHFSIDGRLQNRGKPHYSREERVEEAIRVFRRLGQGDSTVGRIEGLCDELWGNEVSLLQLLDLGKSLGFSHKLEPKLE
jgi:hypothetical protein